jgi:four helix bundle protein
VVFNPPDGIFFKVISVPSNIAEGYERNSSKDFIRFLNIAKGSIGELRTQLYISKKLSYLDENISTELLNKSKEISAMLSGLIKSIKNKKD